MYTSSEKPNTYLDMKIEAEKTIADLDMGNIFEVFCNSIENNYYFAKASFTDNNVNWTDVNTNVYIFVNGDISELK